MKRNFSFYNFFISIIIVLLWYPVVSEHGVSGRIFAMFFSWMLLSGLYAVYKDSIKTRLAALIFGVPTIAFVWLDQFVNSPIIDYCAYIFIFLFMFFVMARVIIYILRAKMVTAEILVAAGSVYLMFGLFWCSIYGMLYYLDPGSFNLQGAASRQLFSNWGTFIYYSFTTLTTLGYGDIVPATQRAQSFAIIQASIGVLFQALLIARVVGMYISQNIIREEG